MVPGAWLWQSMKPGTTVMRCASSVRVSGPMSPRMSLLVPTATKRPFFTANASTPGVCRSTVRTFALKTTRSGSCGSASAARVRSQDDPNAPARPKPDISMKLLRL
jgi:hypothetical protein